VTLPIERPMIPMLARSAQELPAGDEWIYEPKWDGFRALIYKDGDQVHIMSRNGKALTDHFHELAASAKRAVADGSVIDGELVAMDDAGRLDFEGLASRLNVRGPDPNRAVAFVAFDLVATERRDLRSWPFEERRRALERCLTEDAQIVPTTQTDRLDAARRWLLSFRSRGIEGVVAKRRDQRYVPGQRVMVKVRARRTVDCVVGGFIPDAAGLPVVLLLGLIAEDGVLDHVGQSSVLSRMARIEARDRLKRHVGQDSFVDGSLPGWSRWREQRDLEWISVRPVTVCEVAYTAVDRTRLRNAATFLRWRDDREPGDCSARQLV
jgi:ATP-dependent DNA ligase